MFAKNLGLDIFRTITIMVRVNDTRFVINNFTYTSQLFFCGVRSGSSYGKKNTD